MDDTEAFRYWANQLYHHADNLAYHAKTISGTNPRGGSHQFAVAEWSKELDSVKRCIAELDALRPGHDVGGGGAGAGRGDSGPSWPGAPDEPLEGWATTWNVDKQAWEGQTATWDADRKVWNWSSKFSIPRPKVDEP